MLAIFAQMIKASVGIKAIKYFVDNIFRDKVCPVPGSVVYSDLWVGAEHSGIYIDEGLISNIVVEQIAESSVKLSNAKDFTSKSVMGKKIYVSCNKYGPVGHNTVAALANDAVGERSFYGLLFKNCHQFSTKCLKGAENIASEGLLDTLWSGFSLTWEPTIRELKKEAKHRLGANKWLLWDWQADNKAEEPNWQNNIDFFSHLPLNQDTANVLESEIESTQNYLEELADEDIPEDVISKIKSHSKFLQTVLDKYEQNKGFISLYPNSSLTFADLSSVDEDLSHLAQTIQENKQIQKLIKKMGRNHTSELRKKMTKVPCVNRSEVYGTHLSDEIVRILPSELINLEDEILENVFYSRLLENKLMTYELSGTELTNQENIEEAKESTGPIVACLDTSGSMKGEPLSRAKALLIALFHILEKENRSLHILLFGSTGELKQLSIQNTESVRLVTLLKFINQTFSGGTDFETPLTEAINIISSSDNFKKADVLMISDGDCNVSDGFIENIGVKKKELNCMIFSVLCNGTRVKDNFSDEIVTL